MSRGDRRQFVRLDISVVVTQILRCGLMGLIAKFRDDLRTGVVAVAVISDSELSGGLSTMAVTDTCQTCAITYCPAQQREAVARSNG